jgi:hypothetical protein
VRLPLATGRRTRRLVADTGGASGKAPFELILLDEDCAAVNGIVEGEVSLAGAYAGWFSVYSIKVEIAKLNFLSIVRVAGVPKVPEVSMASLVSDSSIAFITAILAIRRCLV